MRGNSSGLKEAKDTGGTSTGEKPGEWYFRGAHLSSLIDKLQKSLRQPVIDDTGLAGVYDFKLDFAGTQFEPPSNEALEQALLDQLGLELVPSREPMEMLVVEKVK
jgi:uncharacterized protein (TIGR03435 family)